MEKQRPSDVVRDIRNFNRRDCPLDSSLVSVDLTSDGISATGCPQMFALEDDTEFFALKDDWRLFFSNVR